MGAQTRGRRRHLIRFQRATEAADATGDPIETWADMFDAWALVKPGAGNERWRDGTPYSEQTIVFDCRHDVRMAELTTKDRIAWGSRIFDVVEVRNVFEANRDAHIVARELDH